MLRRAGARLSDFDEAFEETRRQRLGELNAAFINAIKRNDLARLELLARATYDINAPIVQGIPPLHIAVIENRPDVVRFFARCGADLNSRTRNGAPALYFAREKPDMVTLLRSLGATAAD